MSAVCTRCILPDHFPGITIDAKSGLCSICAHEPPVAELAQRRAETRRSMEQLFDRIRGRGEYDCLVAFSGGKDSSYTLWLLAREYRLRCLAITIDNGFVSSQAVTNCGRVTDALGVDHEFFKPAFAFMRGLYATSLRGGLHSGAALTRASAVCNSCISLINNHMLKTAAQQGIPVVAGGYLGGQVPRDAAMMEISFDVMKRAREVSVKKYVDRLGEEARRFYTLGDELAGKRLHVINPMLAVEASEDDILVKLREFGWQRPTDTGRHSSNCRLNDLAIHLHLKQQGFHPYLAELAEQVRRGLMDRDDALARVGTRIDLGKLGDVVEKLGLESGEL